MSNVRLHFLDDLRSWPKCGRLNIEQQFVVNLVLISVNVEFPELHVHLEGTLEPDLYVKLALKHAASSSAAHSDCDLASSDGPESKRAPAAEESQSIDPISESEMSSKYRSLSNLRDFLELYYANMRVLQEEDDFFQLTWAYMERANANHIVHVEPFFDPSAHTSRGVPFAHIIKGISRALLFAEEKYGMTSCLCMCFVRDHPDALTEALRVLQLSLPYRHLITSVGLDSDEINHPPADFALVFAEARKYGYRCVGHGGHDGPAEPYVSQLISALGVERIDHGVTSVASEELMAYLKQYQLPLTVCPVSNVKIGPFESLAKHPLKHMLEDGLCVCVNSDDPAYLGAYVNDVLCSCVISMGLTRRQLCQLLANSFRASFLPSSMKQRWLHKLQTITEEKDL